MSTDESRRAIVTQGVLNALGYVLVASVGLGGLTFTAFRTARRYARGDAPPEGHRPATYHQERWATQIKHIVLLPAPQPIGIGLSLALHPAAPIALLVTSAADGYRVTMFERPGLKPLGDFFRWVGGQLDPTPPSERPRRPGDDGVSN